MSADASLVLIFFGMVLAARAAGVRQPRCLRYDDALRPPARPARGNRSGAGGALPGRPRRFSLELRARTQRNGPTTYHRGYTQPRRFPE